MIAAENPTVMGRQAVLPSRIRPATTRAMPRAMPSLGKLCMSVVRAALRGDGQALPVGRAQAVPGLGGKVSVHAAKSAKGTANQAAVQPHVGREGGRASATSTRRAACRV